MANTVRNILIVIILVLMYAIYCQSTKDKEYDVYVGGIKEPSTVWNCEQYSGNFICRIGPGNSSKVMISGNYIKIVEKRE